MPHCALAQANPRSRSDHIHFSRQTRFSPVGAPGGLESASFAVFREEAYILGILVWSLTSQTPCLLLLGAQSSRLPAQYRANILVATRTMI